MLKEGVRLDRVRGGRQKYRRSTDPYTPVKNTTLEGICLTLIYYNFVSSHLDQYLISILSCNEERDIYKEINIPSFERPSTSLTLFFITQCFKLT